MLGARRQYVLKALVGFSGVVTLYCVIFSYTSYRDPTSVFFRPGVAYQKLYSEHRQAEAADFISNANLKPQTKVSEHEGPNVCVGVTTIAREGVRYFRDTVGSILHGLSENERMQIHLMLFIAHSDPTIHPAYGEAWMENVADTILTYEVSDAELKHIQALETEKGLYREKGTFDYAYILNACSNTRAKYILIIEDDTLVLDGWFHRTMRALDEVWDKTKALKASSFLYLRLFYTEEYLGWNAEEWPRYLTKSLQVVVVEAIVLFTIRYFSSGSGSLRNYLSHGMLLIYLFAFSPVLILLFFGIGRVTLFPMPRGVVEMSSFGCCAQGLLFPSSRVPEIVDWYRAYPLGFRDTLLEQYADEHRELRWALVPSVIQHIGATSSKDNGIVEAKDLKHGRVVADTLFNFEFELQDPLQLHHEHVQMTGRGVE